MARTGLPLAIDRSGAAVATGSKLTGVDPDAPAIVAVSGGRDSVALLHLLLESGCKQLAVFHLDHALRVESVSDASFVGKLARKLGVPCISERIDVASVAARDKLSIELAARQERYAAFARAARTHRCDKVYVGHHAEDQVETFLMNLFRGSAAAGLRGMQPVSHRLIDGLGLTIIRPMLTIWSEELDAYAKETRMACRDDPSNSDLKHTRNRMRHRILPFLEAEFGRGIKKAVWRASDVLQMEDDLIASLAPLTGAPFEPRELDARAVAKLHPALQRRLLYRWLRDNGIAAAGYAEVEAVRSLLAGGKPAKVNLSADWHARRRSGKLFLEQ